ncbi:hypothetical protein E8D34_09825 [Nocardioides sp. GY 10113]|uniref:LysM peptidoglycan-binding domain-containing protein n=1 Tax=Nocardioides sp. GY 10113 TaxID=2569761 RepID=UPI0010A84474|nr:hypothetical protein [Nocardioides sp. GY 10113]TIC87421.1 hypothetical protein E8D34_09825 [Nocardioides sp. GY 10113]
MGMLTMAVRPRVLAGWCAATAALGATGLLAAPAVWRPHSPDPTPTTFVDLLVAGCAVTATLAAAWLWLLTTLVALPALAGRAPGPGGAGRGAGRSLALALCGLAVVAGAGTATAAGPTDRPAEPAAPTAPPEPAASRVLDGLPLPDRPVGGLRPTVRVTDGDCLWSLAQARLGVGARDGEVAAYVARLHARNRDVVGSDPDLIHPGQELRLPGTTAP